MRWKKEEGPGEKAQAVPGDIAAKKAEERSIACKAIQQREGRKMGRSGIGNFLWKFKFQWEEVQKMTSQSLRRRKAFLIVVMMFCPHAINILPQTEN